MTNLAVISIFRDNAGPYLKRYYEQVSAITGFDLRFYMIEGDSRDQTLEEIFKLYQTDDRVRPVCIKTGLPRYGSVVNQVRFACLSQTVNAGLNQIDIDTWADLVFYVESDLLFSPELPGRLAAHGKQPGLIAPLVFAGPSFYDIWGFRRLADNPRGWSEFTPDPRQITEKAPFEVYSVGSCFLLDAKAIYEGARLGDEALVSFSVRLRTEFERKIWVDPTSVVFHPVPGHTGGYKTHSYLFKASLPDVTVPG